VLKNPANQVANWSGLDLAGFAKKQLDFGLAGAKIQYVSNCDGD